MMAEGYTKAEVRRLDVNIENLSLRIKKRGNCRFYFEKLQK